MSTTPVVPVTDIPLLSHALPFAAMFDELRIVRASRFHDGVGRALFPEKEWAAIVASGTGQAHARAEAALAQALAAHIAAYRALASGTAQSQVAEKSLVPLPPDLNALEGACSQCDLPLKRVLHHLRGNALCLSGGGIRSASLSLGIVQGLARITCSSEDAYQLGADKGNGILHDLQFLSTVSGGGYLGSWLSSWIARLAKSAPAGKAATDESNAREAYKKVVEALAGDRPQTSGDPAPRPVRHLRQFTSYLSPQLGFSLDSFGLGAIVLRNLLINWMMLAPVLLILVTFPTLLLLALRQTSELTRNNTGAQFFGLLSFLIAIAAFSAARSLPSYVGLAESPRGRTLRLLKPGGVVVRFLTPMLAICWMLAAHFYPGALRSNASALDAAALSVMAAVGYGTLALFKWWGYQNAHAGTVPAIPPPLPVARALVLLIAVTVGVSVLTGAGLELTGYVLLPKIQLWKLARVSTIVDSPSYLIVALPAFLAVLLLGSTLFSAFTQQIETEEDREWWARAGGVLLVAGMLWSVGTAVAIYGCAWDLHTGGPGRGMPTIPVLSLLLGAVTSLVGKSSKTEAGTRTTEGNSGGSVLRFLKDRHLLLPALALASLGLMGVSLLRVGNALLPLLPLTNHPVANVCLLLVLLAAAGLIINYLVNINVFSLHGLYRMRLMRAFLGASNSSRNPNPFTDFDRDDTMLMWDLPKAEGVPLHLLGTTLNLVGTNRAEWRQRKAEPFTFSAVSAGAWRLNYVPANLYGGQHGVSLATAMAISGAAANPNMGYHSSPLVTLLMTLFNARLGWWLPNPSYPIRNQYTQERRERFWKHSCPTMGMKPLLKDLFGKTDDNSKWIELSDGGHFDDLGLYEMVMRRCRNIIVVDAGADPDFHFEDLGNALRKIQIDLGIPIRFPDGLRMKREITSANEYYAFAAIDYSCVDGHCFTDETYENPNKPDMHGKRRDMQGRLIYIKASLTGQEPMDVQEYAAGHPLFPHEPTANQFFNEAKFESYRHLGSSMLEKIERTAKGRSWDALIAAVEKASTTPADHIC